MVYRWAGQLWHGVVASVEVPTCGLTGEVKYDIHSEVISACPLHSRDSEPRLWQDRTKQSICRVAHGHVLTPHDEAAMGVAERCGVHGVPNVRYEPLVHHVLVMRRTTMVVWFAVAKM